MVGVPIFNGVVELAAAAPAGFRAATPATPAAAAPATTSEIHRSLWLPRAARNFPGAVSRATDALLKDCELTTTARAGPFTAAMRISNGPAVRFHCMPHTAARPSACVAAISVRAPVLNTPLGPSAGRVKLTVAPSTGRPVSSVTSTVTPRVAREPIAYAAPSPSATRIVRIDGASAPQTSVAAKIAANIRAGLRITSMECAAPQHSLHYRLSQEEGAAIRQTPIQPKMDRILTLLCSNSRSS